MLLQLLTLREMSALVTTNTCTTVTSTTVCLEASGTPISLHCLQLQVVVVPITDEVETLTGPQVKQPKKRFDGILTKWSSFCDAYESSLHHNPTLSKVDKFDYLNLLLESTAADAISGLSLTTVNYEETVVILKRQFGNKQLIIGKHKL